MSTAHTPGPWEVAYLDKNGQAVVKAEHIEVATCWHHCVSTIEEQMKANARLIAASPDVLAALKYARRFLNAKDHDTAFVDAAIAKATGAAP